MREEEKKQSSLKTMLKKRWVFPAIYLASAAVLISMIFWFQASGNKTADEPRVKEESGQSAGLTNEEPAVEVNQSFENVSMPVKNEDQISIATEFFDADAAAEEQEAAMLVDGNKYRPNMGLDLAMKDDKEFEVTAALSGEVTAVRNDSLLGNVIEVTHDDEVKTIYQSVKDIQVKEGDAIKQGQQLATSGTSQLNKEAGNHLHFEIRKGGTALNPQDYFGQPFESLKEAGKDTQEEEDVQADEEGAESSNEADQTEDESGE